MCCFTRFALSLTLTTTLGLNVLSEVAVLAALECPSPPCPPKNSASSSAPQAMEGAQQAHWATLRIWLHPKPAHGRHASKPHFARTHCEPSRTSWAEDSGCSETMTNWCTASRIWTPPYQFSAFSLEVFQQSLKAPDVFYQCHLHWALPAHWISFEFQSLNEQIAVGPQRKEQSGHD